MSDTTAVGAAFGEALNNPRYFDGRAVVAREAATYNHPNSKQSGPNATSTIVDKVLLGDGSEVWQCRICGEANWKSTLSAQSHAGAHNRKPRTTKAQREAAAAVAATPTGETSKAKSLIATYRTVAASATPDRAVVPQDLRGVLRTLTAVKVQLGHMHEALAACTAELSDYAANLTDGLSDSELADLRVKADKYDQMRGLFS